MIFLKRNVIKILFIAFAILTIVSVIATYYKYVVLHDYEVIDDTGLEDDEE